MAQTFTLPNVSLPLGDTNFGPFTVPANIEFFELHFNPRLQPNSNGLALTTLEITFSFDGGVTFTNTKFSMGVFGNPTFVDSKTGSTTDAFVRFDPIPASSQMFVRATTVTSFTLTGATIVVS